MTFPEKEIFTELINAIKSNESFFNGAGHQPPAHYDWDREQYLDASEQKEYPFGRPAVFFRFGEMEYSQKGGLSRKGIIPVEVVVVQDKFVDSADESVNQDLYLKLLEYKYLINSILDYYQAECIGVANMTSMVTDHENRNLHVERIRYSITVTLQKTTIPAD